MHKDLPLLKTLSEAECLDHLAKSSYGRLAFNTDSGPMVLPVNYAFVDPSIIIYTGNSQQMEFAPMTHVAFEIDEADSNGDWGWSVVVRGVALDISTSLDEYSEALRALSFPKWVGGTKDRALKVSVMQITGRSFQATTYTYSSGIDHA